MVHRPWQGAIRRPHQSFHSSSKALLRALTAYASVLMNPLAPLSPRCHSHLCRTHCHRTA